MKSLWFTAVVALASSTSANDRQGYPRLRRIKAMLVSFDAMDVAANAALNYGLANTGLEYMSLRDKLDMVKLAAEAGRKLLESAMQSETLEYVAQSSCSRFGHLEKVLINVDDPKCAPWNGNFGTVVDDWLSGISVAEFRDPLIGVAVPRVFSTPETVRLPCSCLLRRT